MDLTGVYVMGVSILGPLIGMALAKLWFDASEIINNQKKGGGRS